MKQKNKVITVTGVSPTLKKNLETICDKLGVELTPLLKIEGRKALKEIDLKHRIDYGSKQ